MTLSFPVPVSFTTASTAEVISSTESDPLSQLQVSICFLSSFNLLKYKKGCFLCVYIYSCRKKQVYSQPVRRGAIRQQAGIRDLHFRYASYHSGPAGTLYHPQQLVQHKTDPKNNVSREYLLLSHHSMPRH